MEGLLEFLWLEFFSQMSKGVELSFEENQKHLWLDFVHILFSIMV